MTNADLADWLNRELALTGRASVTTNVIRQWVGWNVLPQATARAKGRARPIEWERTGDALLCARRLAELRQFGVTQKSAVIAHAWLESGFEDFGAVRSAFQAAFKTARAQLLRNVTSDTRHTHYSDLSRARVNALRRQGGPLDGRLVGTPFQLPAATILRTLDAAITGESAESEVASKLGEHLGGLLSSMSGVSVDAFAVSMAQGITGLFGDIDEVERPGVFTLNNAPARHFKLARYLWRQRYLKVPEQYAALLDFRDEIPLLGLLQDIFRQIGPSIYAGPWAICSFVGILHHVENKREFKYRLLV